MKISVLTPCLNSERTIGHTLESFLGQTHTDKELLILDGGSTDDTLGIVARFPAEGVRVFPRGDSGMYDALNLGLSLYSGDAVGCLNSDDRYHDARALADGAGAREGADMVSADLDFVRDHEPRHVVRRWRGSLRPPGGFRSGWMPAHPTLYVRREVATAVGPFDPTYTIAADYDWMLRAYELHSFEHRHLDRILVDMRDGGMSNAGVRARLRHNLEALRSRRRWLQAGAVDLALLTKPLRKVNQYSSRTSG
jgi:glycosyltransferase involved in cell wall biosynthesis